MVTPGLMAGQHTSDWAGGGGAESLRSQREVRRSGRVLEVFTSLIKTWVGPNRRGVCDPPTPHPVHRYLLAVPYINQPVWAPTHSFPESDEL